MTMTDSDTNTTKPTGSLMRAMTLLRVMAEAAPQGLPIAELTSRSELPRPTVYRVLNTLATAGWVEKREDDRYYFGMEFYGLGQAASSQQRLDRVARPHLEHLRDQLGQTVYLIARSGQADAICVARLETNDIIKMLVMGVGTRIPLGLGAGGLALVSALPEPERSELIEIALPRLRERPSFDAETFRAALDRAQAEGFSSHKGLFTSGVAGLGVPILNAAGYPIAAISTAFLTEWISPASYENCAARMRQTAERISAALAGRAEQTPTT
ncbi:MAG: IclR family transcriptional regulator [Pseudomonadota bacterium]|nr:IclR family transcriptional regulator [Pseudomonadota bacterium]